MEEKLACCNTEHIFFTEIVLFYHLKQRVPGIVQSFNFSIFSISGCIDCTHRCTRGCFWFQDKLPVSQLHQTRISHKHLFIPGVLSSMSRLAQQRMIYLVWMQHIFCGEIKPNSNDFTQSSISCILCKTGIVSEKAWPWGLRAWTPIALANALGRHKNFGF